MRWSHEYLVGLVVWCAVLSTHVQASANEAAEQTPPEEAVATPTPQPSPAADQKPLPPENVAETLDEGAAEAAQSGEVRPWAEGVSQASQDAARGLFLEGNELLRDSSFSEAIGKYLEAIKHWDHPAIHYNHALALSTLDKPIRMREELELAMLYGAAPLGAVQFQQAERYKALVEKQLAYVTIACDSPQAVVYLDGSRLFVAPGRYEGFVLPGEHMVSAKRNRHVTDERQLTLLPFKPTQVRLGVYTEEQLTKYKRMMPEYQPWLVTGAGVLLSGLGTWAYISGRDLGRNYDSKVAALCTSSRTVDYGAGPGESTDAPEGTSVDSSGCASDFPATAKLQDQRDRAETRNTVGIVMMAAGGAALTTGAVLLYLNQAQPHRLRPQDMLEQGSRIDLSAGVSPSGAMLIGRGTF